MTRKFVPCCLAILLTIIASCQKETSKDSGDPTQPIENKAIEHKWFLVNIIIYSNPDLTGPSFFGYTGDGTEYYDFRADGKLYVFAQNSFDTATYKILPDSTMLAYPIVNGITFSQADTAKIRKLTADSLILSSRNPANDYGKFTFRK